MYLKPFGSLTALSRSFLKIWDEKLGKRPWGYDVMGVFKFLTKANCCKNCRNKPLFLDHTFGGRLKCSIPKEALKQHEQLVKLRFLVERRQKPFLLLSFRALWWDTKASQSIGLAFCGRMRSSHGNGWTAHLYLTCESMCFIIMLLAGVSSAAKCALLLVLEVHQEIAMGQCLGRTTLHMELVCVFPFDLKDGNGAFGEKILSLDFYFKFVFSCNALGFILEIDQCQCWHIDIELVLLNWIQFYSIELVLFL